MILELFRLCCILCFPFYCEFVSESIKGSYDKAKSTNRNIYYHGRRKVASSITEQATDEVSDVVFNVCIAAKIKLLWQFDFISFTYLYSVRFPISYTVLYGYIRIILVINIDVLIVYLLLHFDTIQYYTCLYESWFNIYKYLCTL